MQDQPEIISGPELVNVPAYTYRKRDSRVVVNVKPHTMRMPSRDQFGHFIATLKSKVDQQKAGPRTEPLAASPVEPLDSPSLRDAERDSRSERERSERDEKERLRYLLTTGMTATQAAQKLNKPLDSVRDEAEKMWKELARDLITTPLNVRVQAIMRAMTVYAQSCQALDLGQLRTAERIKYMGLALDSSKEIVKYQSEIARDEKNGGRDERITKEDLDTAISLLDQYIANLEKGKDKEFDTSPADGTFDRHDAFGE